MAAVQGITVEQLENLVKIMNDVEKLDPDSEIAEITVKVAPRFKAKLTKDGKKEWQAEIIVEEPISNNYLDR